MNLPEEMLKLHVDVLHTVQDVAAYVHGNEGNSQDMINLNTMDMSNLAFGLVAHISRELSNHGSDRLMLVRLMRAASGFDAALRTNQQFPSDAFQNFFDKYMVVYEYYEETCPDLLYRR